MHERELFVFQNKQLTALHYVRNVSSTKFGTELFSMLKIRRISTLKYFGIAKNTIIIAKAANDLATALSHNCNGLEQFSKLAMTHLLMIMEVLVKFTNLKVFEIDNITDQVTECLMSIISHNAPLYTIFWYHYNSNLYTTSVIQIAKVLQNTSHLQELTITVSSTRATNVIATAMSDIKFLKALRDIVTITKLFISNNNITDEAANDIASVLSFNTRLQELDISYNCFQAVGIVIIVKAFQSMLTKLYIGDNNITEDAADDIAAVISMGILNYKSLMLVTMIFDQLVLLKLRKLYK